MFSPTETELASPEQGREGLIPGGKEEIIKLLEKKALNFLVNEYLLLSNYKLTSVTFSEENGDQVITYLYEKFHFYYLLKNTIFLILHSNFPLYLSALNFDCYEVLLMRDKSS